MKDVNKRIRDYWLSNPNTINWPKYQRTQELINPVPHPRYDIIYRDGVNSLI